jgi:hypothetical protein
LWQFCSSCRNISVAKCTFSCSEFYNLWYFLLVITININTCIGKKLRFYAMDYSP